MDTVTATTADMSLNDVNAVTANPIASKPTAAAATAAGAVVAAPKSFARRDRLRSMETKVQKDWEDKKVYEVNRDDKREKYFLNFPYPYMNGRLHLGHAFSLTKAEFTARFQRLLGKNVLFPFAFHCTGMPIQAAANKLRDEIAKYGLPPVFPTEEDADTESKKETTSKSSEESMLAKSKGKKTKLLVKGLAGKPMRQWDILCKMVPEEEIGEFADPIKWLKYFPPYGAADLKAFGSAIDWRRSFITTSANPYYDAFIRWQFNRLKEGNRIKFGKRANVFSILDGQVCADHDRASGEGVGPQEYTIIKLLIQQPYPAGSALNCEALLGKKVYLAPATLRPETMYGQTNCFVLPEGEYGAFEINAGDVLVMSERAARGLAHQGFMNTWGEAKAIITLRGTELLGLPLKAPHAVYETVYTLPLLSISMSKGTGVVTSVPSDAPDDFAALRELKDKPLWREKFGLTEEMVVPFDVVPIIDIPGYGNVSAVTMCERLNIASPKDTENLKKAKDEVYLKGFYEGIMLVGECKGMKVCDAKPVIRQSLINSGDAIGYYEPESNVMSRSGDECVVALTDQWYLSYGEQDWQQIVSKHIHSDAFNAYNDRIMETFDGVLGWLKEWACSRQFGLGTQLPWDTQWVIESLSDSTIYMAYYTIAHILHGSVDNMDGVSVSNTTIKPEDLTDDVFNYIYLHKEIPSNVTVNVSTAMLDTMRSEFEYWYPIDLRVSAKDLIPNHLTMSLYNHVEVWKDFPEMWPKSIYCNGHIMVDAEKMSKSKGNFLSMLETVESYGADATRFALADAGDSLDDANFDRMVANQAVSYLYNEEIFINEILADATLRDGEFLFFDTCFNTEMDYLIEATKREYSNMCYREGIHRCFFDMTILRDIYRDWSSKCNIPMHRANINRYIESFIVMLSPICPHWSEFMWNSIGKSTFVCDAAWPAYVPYDKHIKKQFKFFNDFIKNSRHSMLKEKKLSSKRGAYFYIANTYDDRKKQVLRFLTSVGNSNNDGFPADILAQMKTYIESQPELVKETKALMQFGAFMKGEALERGMEALATEMSFDQMAMLQENSRYLSIVLELGDIAFYCIDDVSGANAIPGDAKKIALSTPGRPSACFYNLVN